MSTAWVTQQILGGVGRLTQGGGTQQQRVQFGNRFVGQPSEGSATERVLLWLDGKSRGSWWSRRQIVIGTGCTDKSVDWALLFLRQTRRIEATPDEGRRTSYLKYRSTRINSNRKEGA